MSIDVVKIPIQTSKLKPYIKEGDTIPKITITIDENGLDLTTSTIKMQVYNGNTKIINISNGTGITVISSTVLEIDEISALNNNLPYGSFEGDFEITDVNGVKKTYFNVIYTIIKQFTK